VSSDLFKKIEKSATGNTYALEDVLNAMPWNVDGLVPAIAQQRDSGEVLMMAWMNRAALEETLTTGRVCYWSRSRSRFWRKGEQSGQIQLLKEAFLDCDGDTLLLKVDQTGPACHTGRKSCFYTALNASEAKVIDAPMIDADELYGAH